MVSDLADHKWRATGSRRSTSHWLQRRGHTATRQLRVGCRAFDAIQGVTRIDSWHKATFVTCAASREVEPGQLIHHADHGCQYTSIKLTTRLLRAGVQGSMGSVGDSYDNALAENLWMITKTECIRGRVFATRAEANLALFEYIDGFYNSRRIQKRLGYLSPIEFEEKHYAEQAAAERANLKPRQPALTS